MLSSGHVLRERYRLEDPFTPDCLNVYKAYDTIENRSCLVKIAEGDEAARFEREAEALASHHHPNLPLIYDHFKDSTYFYAILESPEGETLHARLRRTGKIQEDDALPLMRQILSAFDYVHALNLPICRGGFAPSYLWINSDNELKIFGAGLTEVAPLPDGERSLFIAPEGGDDQRADVFSAAAVLFTLLTDHAPEFSSPRKHNPEITLPTAQIILRAITPRPEGRYATIREMRKALGRAKQRHEQVEIALSGSHREFPVQLALIGVAAVVVLLLVGFGWVSAMGGSNASTPTVIAASANTVTPPTAPAPSPLATLVPLATAPMAASPSPSPQPTPIPTLTAVPVIGSTAISKKDNMPLVFVPAGEFEMGSNDNDLEASDSEKPRHKVKLPDYWIDKTEVTNQQYQLCVEAGGCSKLSITSSPTRPDYYVNVVYADYPLIWLSWDQASAYCKWAGRRLPSENEWEKAARGVDARLYPWGNDAPNNTLLNYDLLVGDTTKVGSYPNGASPYSALDMSGNVIEWVEDFYYSSFFPLLYNPTMPPPLSVGIHALRSSSWAARKAEVRVSVRHFNNRPDGVYNNVGFRCASSERP
ncbi:MAG: SUMF1/EgtB/PvdO family nonheme iron enzyme [Chloroflexi bacterium]|nr:SUMF1/EgtB/PvdO family nonheme iron enzyme [Chloroflexota bacterium]